MIWRWDLTKAYDLILRKHIQHLRKKLGAGSIETVRRQYGPSGYRWRGESKAVAS